MRWHKLHPIRDRALIDALLPVLYARPDLTLKEAIAAAHRPVPRAVLKGVPPAPGCG
jgi:hypothetical protein